MTTSINKSLITKVHMHSKKLAEDEALMDQPWVLLNDKYHLKPAYIFGSDNKLRVSKGNKSLEGHWEKIEEKSLLIELENQTHIYKHGFFDECILALKEKGGEAFSIFYNEDKMPKKYQEPGKISSYIKDRYIQKAKKEKQRKSIKPKIEDHKSQKKKNPFKNYIVVKSGSGSIIHVERSAPDSHIIEINAKVYKNGKRMKSGQFYDPISSREYVVSDGSVSEQKARITIWQLVLMLLAVIFLVLLLETLFG